MSEAPSQTADLLAADTAARLAALDPARSFIVQAPAGSGKTTLLTQRLLALLVRCTEPEEVLAITFTRKAAAEMHKRVLDALDAARRSQPVRDANDQRTRELAVAVLARDDAAHWGLLAEPGRLRIMTFDALCQWLAGRLPIVSGTGAAPVVTTEAGPLYREAARRALARLDDNDEAGRAVAEVLRWVENDVPKLEALLCDLLARREHWLRRLSAAEFAAEPAAVRSLLEESLGAVVEEALAAARDALPHALRIDALTHLRHAARHRPAEAAQASPASPEALGAAHDLGATAADLGLWRGLVGLVLTADGKTVRSRLTVEQGFPAQAKAEKAAAQDFLKTIGASPTMAAAIRRIAALPAAAYTDRQWLALQSIVIVLGIAAAELELVFAARGAVDFVAVARAALMALGGSDEPSDLALRLDYRLSHLLVDEFQDTSAAQVALLERLTAGFADGDGRTVFLVGDPMQSIYRFREADVGLFLRVRDAGLGALRPEPLRLEANFRSSAPLVEWTNRVFAAVLPAADDLTAGAVRHAAARAARAPTGAGVVLHLTPGAGADAEGRAIADFIAARRAQEPKQTIAVLGRARSHLTPVARALTVASIPFQGVDLMGLGERLAVRDLEALTRALCHPLDRSAWLACLRAPFVGVALADLETLVAGERDAAVAELAAREDWQATLEAPLRARIRAVLAAFAAARAERGRRPLAAVVEALWVGVGGPATLREPTDLANAEAFLDALGVLERGADLDDPLALAEDLGQLYAAVDPAADATLQLLTVHHAKGLEWDVVILCGLARDVRPEERRLLHWLDWERPDGGRGLVLAPRPTRADRDEPIGRWLRALDEERSLHEMKRLLYVATTRAIRELHLFGSPKVRRTADGEVELAQPGRKTALGLLEAALHDEWRAACAAPAPQDGGAGATAGAAGPAEGVVLERLADDWQAPPPPAGLPLPGPLARAAAAPEFVWVREPARHAGTVVHEELARGDVLTGPADAARIRRRLREAGLEGPYLRHTLERCRAALAAVAADPRGRWLFEPTHRLAANELPLTGRDRGAPLSIVIDRTFVDADGVRWIIDYKTSTHEGAGREAFLDSEVARYRSQLEGYARLMAEFDPGRPLRVGLYFPLLPGWRAWEPGVG
jgi:ATP-dependent helicase/nuclease subunit A